MLCERCKRSLGGRALNNPASRIRPLKRAKRSNRVSLNEQKYIVSAKRKRRNFSAKSRDEIPAPKKRKSMNSNLASGGDFPRKVNAKRNVAVREVERKQASPTGYRELMEYMRETVHAESAEDAIAFIKRVQALREVP